MDGKIGVFLGRSGSAFNAQLDARNFGSTLQNQFEIDLIATELGNLKSDLQSIYSVYGRKFSSTLKGESIALRRYLSEEDPNIVLQIVRPPEHGFVVGALSNQFGYKAVYRYSGDTFRSYQAVKSWKKIPYLFHGNLLGRISLSLCDEFITLGPIGKRRLIDRGVDSSQIKIIPPLIDSNRINSNTSANQDLYDEKYVVLFIGRFTRMKGIDRLISAAKNILQMKGRNDFRFVLVGGDEDEVSIPADVRNKFTITGRVSPKQIPKYICAADVLALPSRLEGLPRVLIECLYLGTPVVATPVGEIPHITQNIINKNHTLEDYLLKIDNIPIDSAEDYLLENNQDELVEYFLEIIEEDS